MLGNFPEPVWYHPDGIANIMSLSSVQRHYRVNYDDIENIFTVHHPENDTHMTFQCSERGLYYHDIASQENSWDCTMVNTVRSNAQKYNNRLYRAAVEARRFQNIIMRPNTRDLKNIIIPKLRNCPIAKADVIAAEDIFGPNLGSLKGKTPRRTPRQLEPGIDPVPEEILSIHQSVTLLIDIFFINKLPFLVTMARDIKFTTIVALTNRQVPTICKHLNTIIDMYKHRGFSVKSIIADGEFEAIRPHFPLINTTSRDEHVPQIERHIRSIKDRVRSTYNMLPFKYIPKIMLTQMVHAVVFWMNAFPVRDGVSNDHSPRYIMTGYNIDYL